MVVVPLLFALGAAPAANSAWRWSFERTPSGQGTAMVDGKKRHFTLETSGVDRLTLDLKVLEWKDAAPARLDFTVSDGPAAIEGRRWLVESDYGEARMVLPPGQKPTEYQAGLEKMNPGVVPDLRRAVALLIKPDPFLAAIADGPPCAPETLARVAAATGEFLRAAAFGTTSDVSTDAPSAKCRGKGASYQVAVTVKVLNGSGSLTFPFKGTVDAPAGAWRSTVDVSGAADFVPDGSRVQFKGKVKLRVKSRVTKG